MQDFSSPGHLLHVYNIPYTIDKNAFNQYLKQFGEMSQYVEMIHTHGSCFVSYFDIRSAEKAYADINSAIYQYQADYAFNNNNIFPIEKTSSEITICKKNNESIEISDIIASFKEFGEIQNVNSNKNKKNISIKYFDSRSSVKACNSDLGDYNIKLIKKNDSISNITLSENCKAFYDRENKDYHEIQNLKSKNQMLQEKIEFYEKEYSKLKKVIEKNEAMITKNYQQKYSNLKRTLKYRKRRRRKFYKKKMNKSNDIQKSSIFFTQPDFKKPSDFQSNTEIMDELNKLKTVEPKSRRFSDKLYEYSFSLYLYSAKCYKFVLQTFPFPSVSSLYYHFGDELNRNKDYICNLKYSKFLLDSYIEIFEIPSNTPCIISGDATVASGNPMYKSIQKNGCVYLYLLQTIFPEIPVLPFHLKLNASSKFKHENFQDMMYLKSVLEDLNLLCFCISTDGDNGIDHYHKQVFEDFDSFINDKNEVIAHPKSAHPIIDIYHVLKTQRTRFFKEDLSLSPLSPIFKRSIIQNLVQRKACFSDMNDSIRFMDEYGIDFFSPLSFLDVISNKEIIPFSYYLLPFILWQCSMRYQKLSISQRIYFLNLSFLIFKKEYDNFHGRSPEHHFYEENVDGCQILTFWQKSSLIKFMNTLIATIYILKNYPDSLIYLQRLTNYPIEKTFGNVREYMNNSIDENLFKNVLVHNVMRKEMDESLNLKDSTKKLNESGGVIVSPDDEVFFDFNSEKIEEEIDYLRKCAFSFEYEIEMKDLLHLKTLMENLCNDPNNHDMIPHHQSSTASKQILMRWQIPIHDK